MKTVERLTRGMESRDTGKGTTPSGATCPEACDLVALAPAGYYIALRMGFGAPVEEINHLPDSWIEEYTRNGYAPFDPLIRWVHTETGTVRWSAIEQSGDFPIMARAKAHRMKYGAVASFRVAEPGRQRSFGIFARPDREFLDDELKQVFEYVESLHVAVSPPQTLTECELEALRFVRDGGRLKEVAWQIGITEGAVKQRLKSARAKLGAKTSAESIAKAARYRLL